MTKGVTFSTSTKKSPDCIELGDVGNNHNVATSPKKVVTKMKSNSRLHLQHGQHSSTNLTTHPTEANKWYKHWFQNVIEKFQSDAIHIIRSLMVMCVVWIGLTWSILHVHADPLDHDVNHLTSFDHAIYASLLIAVPMVFEQLCESNLSFFSNCPSGDREDRSRRITSRLILFTIIVPHTLIYFRIIKLPLISLVLFYEFLCLCAVLLYRLCSLATLPSCAALKAAYAGLIISAFFAFLYNLCTYNTMEYKLVWKSLLAISLSLSMLSVLWKVSTWYRYVQQMTTASKQRHTKMATFCGYAVLVVLLVAMVVVFVVSLGLSPLVFFAAGQSSQIFLVAIYSVVMLATMRLQSYEVHKAERHTKQQLAYHRKMTRSISHEIRTPLNTAFMGLDLLISNIKELGSTTSSKARGSVASSSSEVNQERLNATLKIQKQDLLETAMSVKEGCDISLGILNQLLTFEKLSAGMMQLEPKLVSLLDLLEHNAILFRMQAQQIGIRFVIDLTTEEKALYRDIAVHVDEHKINQVIRNLLSNAMKFTPKHGTVIVKVYWHNPVRSATNVFERSTSVYRMRSDAHSSSSTAWPHGLTCTALPADAVLSPQDTDLEAGLSRVRPGPKSAPAASDHSITATSWLPSFNQKSKSNSNSNLATNTAQSNTKSFASYSASLKQNQQRSQSKGAMETQSSKVDVFQDIIRELVHQPIAGTKSAGSMVISIIDSGPGVSAEDQKKLFQEYVQISPGELQKGQGTGLGLSISKAIVQLHGGNIAMTSEGRGKGSTFFIELPAYRKINTHNSSDVLGSVLQSYRSNDSDTSKSLITSLRKHVQKVSGRIAGQHLFAPRPSPEMRKVVPTAASSVSHEEEDEEEIEKEVDATANVTTARSKEDDLVRMVSFQEADADADAGHHLDVSPKVPPKRLQQQPASVEDKLTVLQSISSSNLLSSEDLTDPQQLPRPDLLQCASNSSDLSGKQMLLSASASSRDSFGTLPSLLHILLVDDSVPNRKMLSRLLSRDGHMITEVNDGKDAVALIRQLHEERSVSVALSVEEGSAAFPARNKIDLILIDYFMVSMNGPEAVKHIRALGFVGPIIGVTGLMDDDSNEFIDHGADIVLCKPVSLAAIWKALKSIRYV